MNPYLLIIHFSIGIFSWILYGFVTRYINKHRKQFNSAFTRLSNTFTLINLMQYITMKLYYQIPLHTPKSSELGDVLEHFPSQLAMTCLYVSTHYFLYCQRICIVLIISISFRVIVFPFSSSPIWERNYLLTASIIFLLPMPFISNAIFLHPTFNYAPDLDGYILYPASKTHAATTTVRNLLQSNFFDISTAIVCSVLKFSSLCSLNTNSLRKRDDRNLYVVTTILLVTSLFKFSCAMMIAFPIARSISLIFVYLYPIFADMVALSCPYTLIYINHRIRRHLFGNYRFLGLATRNPTSSGTSV